MKQLGRIGVVGCGPSAVYLIKHLLDHQRDGRLMLDQLHVFERESSLGHGMPYNPRTTDCFNLCNISSAEIPPPCETFADWLQLQSEETLQQFGIKREDINSSETYSRIAVGRYYQDQCRGLMEQIRRRGTEVVEHRDCQVIDILDDGDDAEVVVVDASQRRYGLDRLVIATGHAFAKQDAPDSGYFASPWPIQKLLPGDGVYLKSPVGLLGASLSAFDVVASLAHRHGHFKQEDASWRFLPDPGAEGFRIVMHSAQGWLPHLQYEQQEPFREIHRYASREQIEGLLDHEGFLPLQRYFDDVCRPALADAFDKDDRPEIARGLRSGEMTLNRFVEQMVSEHQYEDPFEGMRSEFPEADVSVHLGKPIHWKETLDDLMYCLNFHAEMLCAEDHDQFRDRIQPFLMCVIAAMPLQSARSLLALHDAGILEIVAGLVEVKEKGKGYTVVEIDNEGERSEHRYCLFIDCSGHEPITIENYPFRSLVESGRVVEATAKRRSDRDSSPSVLPGIMIDSMYRFIDINGDPNERIQDIAMPHAVGYRPYSYGLQACNDTAAIAVNAWTLEDKILNDSPTVSGDEPVLPKAS